MFCSSCGEKCQEDAKFCPSCGNSLAQSGSAESAEENLQALKQYENHVDDVTCLECGHKGIKGLIRATYPWYGSFWLWGIPLADTMYGWIAAGFPWYSFTVVLVIATVVRASGAKRELHCPGCDQEIIA